MAPASPLHSELRKSSDNKEQDASKEELLKMTSGLVSRAAPLKLHEETAMILQRLGADGDLSKVINQNAYDGESQ